MRNMQWMIVVPQDAPEAVIDKITERVSQQVTVLRDEFPEVEIKFAILTFDEAIL